MLFLYSALVNWCIFFNQLVKVGIIGRTNDDQNKNLIAA